MSERALSAFVESVCGDSHLRVEDDLGDGFVRLKSSEAERRQAAHDIRSTEDAVIEMLRNARDAGAQTIFLAMSRDENTRRLTMIDDGCGIPQAMHERIFEPRVTSKLDTMHFDKWGVHGRGMALYSIKVNAKHAFVATSDIDMGSAFVVETDLTQLSEKTDQSTFPTFEVKDSGTLALRGPKNVIRTVCEFALESRNTCSVYFGSISEIAATLYAFGKTAMPVATRTFCHDYASLPLCKRLAISADPAMFARIAHSLGLVMSERNARRVMDGDIAPLDSMLDRLKTYSFSDVPARTKSKDKSKKLAKDARGLKLDESDVRSLKAKGREILLDLAPRYYLDSGAEVVVQVASDAIKIIIPAEKLR